MHIVLLAVLGLVAGSFISAWTYRLHEGKSVIKGRSACPRCGHTLAWYDLVPLLSWVGLLGKCRYCRQPISWQYPLLEVVTALVFAAAAFGSQPLGGWELILYIAAATVLVAASTYDLRWMELPDVTSIVLIVIAALGTVALAVQEEGSWWVPVAVAVIGAAVAAGFFALQYLVSRGRWIGSGDILLGAGVGLLVGWPAILLALLMAYLSGSVVAIVGLASQRRGWKSTLPFGPFLALGALVAWRFGPPIMAVLGWV